METSGEGSVLTDNQFHILSSSVTYCKKMEITAEILLIAVVVFIASIESVSSSERSQEYPRGSSPGQQKPVGKGEEASSSQPSGSGKQYELECSSLRRTPPGECSSRVRSRSPTRSIPSIKILGYSLKQLGYMRLISRKKPDMQFEFRIHVFTADKPIRLRTEGKRFTPVPPEEQIVLSAPNGDIFAILDFEGFLRPIYKAAKHNPRVKINMISAAVDIMTADEIMGCPAGRNHAIFPTNFNKAFADSNSLHLEGNPFCERDLDSSSIHKNPRHRKVSHVPSIPYESSSPPGRPPSDRVLGLTMERLGYIRLIPRANQNRRFKFRRYVIPTNAPIRVQWRGNNFVKVPTQEYIVLSTSDEDAFALLEYTGVLRGLYMADKTHHRTKMNIVSGAIAEMNATERNEVHVGESYPIFPRWFDKVVSNNDSLQKVYSYVN